MPSTKPEIATMIADQQARTEKYQPVTTPNVLILTITASDRVAVIDALNYVLIGLAQDGAVVDTDDKGWGWAEIHPIEMDDELTEPEPEPVVEEPRFVVNPDTYAIEPAGPIDLGLLHSDAVEMQSQIIGRRLARLDTERVKREAETARLTRYLESAESGVPYHA